MCLEVSVWVINKVKKKKTATTQSIYVANKHTWKLTKVNEESNIRQRITEAFINQWPTLRNLLPRQLQEVVHLSPGDQRCLQSDSTSNSSKQTQQLTCLTCKTHQLKTLLLIFFFPIINLGRSGQLWQNTLWGKDRFFYVLWYAVIKYVWSMTWIATDVPRCFAFLQTLGCLCVGLRSCHVVHHEFGCCKRWVQTVWLSSCSS